MYFDYDEESGVTKCEITDKEKTFTGYATCSETDRDMMNSFTGGFIAENRAMMALLRDLRDNEILPQLKILRHLYGNMQTSKRFDSYSYEATMIRRELERKEQEYAIIRNLIKEKRNELTDFIKDKEICYKRVRRHRELEGKGQK